MNTKIKHYIRIMCHDDSFNLPQDIRAYIYFNRLLLTKERIMNYPWWKLLKDLNN